jgi:cytochrome P450
MVLQETMRIYPPAPWFSRSAIEDDEIDGYPIPAGSVVAVIPWIMHRHPDHWDDPEAFDPERFTPERVAARDRLAYLPFGAGPRQCIGTHFALLEATLIAAMIARRFRVVPSEGVEATPQALITLRPEGGVPVQLEAR